MQRKFSFSSTPFPKENLVFTLNAENLTNRFIFSRWVSLPVVVLFFISGRCVSADPAGDFFKKVSQSVSKAFQPRPTPNPTEKKATTKRAARRPSSRILTATAASPTPLEKPTDLVKEDKVTPAVVVQRAASAPPEKAKEDVPYGIPVPGHKGMVTSPFSPEGNYIDVSAFASGSAVRDPYTGKIFLVP
ncbi:MAG: hypothetical protein ACJ8KC_07875 [Candidatus Udaeobacter sp.]